MEQQGSELARLFGIFEKMNPEGAGEWMAYVTQSGTLIEVGSLASAYKKQNEEIHSHCACRKRVESCSLQSREEEWLREGGVEKFPFQSCGLGQKVSEAAWGAFSYLLTASEHASQLAAELGRSPSGAELWNHACEEWHGRIAARFRPIRESRFGR